MRAKLLARGAAVPPVRRWGSSPGPRSAPAGPSPRLTGHRDRHRDRLERDQPSFLPKLAGVAVSSGGEDDTEQLIINSMET